MAKHLREFVEDAAQRRMRNVRGELLLRNNGRGLLLACWRRFTNWHAAYVLKMRRRNQQRTHAEAMLSNTENGCRRVFFLRMRKVVDNAAALRKKCILGELLMRGNQRGLLLAYWRCLGNWRMSMRRRHQQRTVG